MKQAIPISWLILAVIQLAGLAGRCGQSPPATRTYPSTRLSPKGPAPDIEGSSPPEMRTLTEPRTDAERLAYTSEGRTLFGYFMRPSGKGPFPAVLYAHSGFQLRDFDIDNAKEFVKRGFAVFLPTWRGENGNAGSFEMWFGEVRDAAAALDLLKNMPGIDESRLYATGHSAGGTIAMLLAETDSGLRAAAASGGSPTMYGWNYPWVPIDLSDPNETKPRSPGENLKQLQIPLALFYGGDGSDGGFIPGANAMQEQAPDRITVTVVQDGSHKTAMRMSIPAMVKFFLAH